MTRHPDREPDGTQIVLCAFERRESNWCEIASGYLVEAYHDLPDHGI